ncbi:MAG: DUF167 domain-containing protein [Acidimicrobiaceae bacterium]|nr:DUF167 domain-containing protein [Acidimicrobiaceae bacterium]
MRLEIHVRPNASSTTVGGTHGDALVVRVTQPADQGKATAAALRAVADALEIPSRSVTLVRGATSRKKLLDIATSPSEMGSLERRLTSLLEAPARP